MFTQSDWWEVTQAGVGTNRYCYSFSDPVNLSDSSGNAAVYKDGKYVGQVNPGNVGYYQVTHDHVYGDLMASEYARYNEVLRSAQGGGLGETVIGADGVKYRNQPNVLFTMFKIVNSTFVFQNTALNAFVRSKEFYALAVVLLEK